MTTGLQRGRCGVEKRSVLRFLVLRRLLLPGIALLLWARGADAASQDRDQFRFAFSSQVLGEMQEHDARAAAKAWAKSLVEQFHLKVDPDGRAMESEAMRSAILSGSVDGVAITLEEYISIGGHAGPMDRMVVSVTGNRTCEAYVVLAEVDSGIKDLGDLRGKHLVIHADARMVIARPWLEVCLRDGGWDRMEAHVRTVTVERRINRVVLPVFFRKADAALVTERGFEAMAELNPQLRRRLKVVLRSECLVPVAFFFRRGFAPEFTAKLIEEISNPRPSLAFQQVLAVFRADSLVERPLADLDPTLHLLSRFQVVREGERPKS